jgi:quinol monooxygenase YgiN
MIYVVATITVKSEHKKEFIEIFKSNVPNVLNEQGCIEYNPTVDYKMGWAAQVTDENTVIIVEKWESPEALDAHNNAPHMKEYREKTAGMVEKVEVRILQNA